MKLEKAVIEPDGGPAIPVLFNPAEFTLRRSNRLVGIGGSRRREPGLQYSGGHSGALTMDLFFDTFEERADVCDHTDRLYGLLDPDGAKGPPPCTFRWGRFSFRGILESVDGRFTLFLPDGTPARATLSVSFRSRPAEGRAGGAPAAGLRRSRVLRQGDTLNAVAASVYGDPGRWRPIARANGIHDPLALRPGAPLMLPAPE